MSVIDAMGERFVEGIGRQEYDTLESAMVDLWNAHQDGGRWKVFRMGPMSYDASNAGPHLLGFKATLPHAKRATGRFISFQPGEPDLFAGRTEPH